MALDKGDNRRDSGFKIAVDGVVHAGTHGEPTAASQDGDDDGEAEKLPCGESKLNRQALQSDPPQLLYPTPRSVCRRRGRPGRSTFERRKRMKTSRLFSLTSRSPQTRSMTRSRLTTRPAERMRHARMEKSVRVSSSP